MKSQDEGRNKSREESPHEGAKPAAFARRPAMTDGLVRRMGFEPGQVALPLLIAGTFFMQNLDASVITPAIPAMAGSFGVRPVELNLGVSAYILTVGVFIPVSGWAARRFGARRIFLIAICLFTLASLLCGFSRTLPQFIAARILQGLGGAMMVPVGRYVVLSLTPKDRLMGVIALLTWPGLVAPVLGPPLGGLVIDSAGWRWIFWLNLPLGLIAITAALRLLPRLERDPGRRFDWLGFALIAPALFCILFAAESMGAKVPSWGLVALLGGGGLGLLALGYRHLRRSDHPILHFGAMRFATFRVPVLGGSIFRLSINATPFLLPIFFQLAFGWSAFRAGLMMTAIFAGNIAMKPMTTPLLRRFGFRTVLLWAGACNTLAVLAFSFVGPGISFPLLLAVLFASGLVRSMQFTAMNTLAFADVPQAEMSEANTLFSTIVQLARALGVAVGAIFWRIGQSVYPEDVTAGFQLAFLLIAALSLLALIDSWMLSRDAAEEVRRGPRRR